jgi:hypothetical protein
MLIPKFINDSTNEYDDAGNTNAFPMTTTLNNRASPAGIKKGPKRRNEVAIHSNTPVFSFLGSTVP